MANTDALELNIAPKEISGSRFGCSVTLYTCKIDGYYSDVFDCELLRKFVLKQCRAVFGENPGRIKKFSREKTGYGQVFYSEGNSDYVIKVAPITASSIFSTDPADGYVTKISETEYLLKDSTIWNEAADKPSGALEDFMKECFVHKMFDKTDGFPSIHDAFSVRAVIDYKGELRTVDVINVIVMKRYHPLTSDARLFAPSKNSQEMCAGYRLAVLELSKHLLSALRLAHEKSIIHRDIKPQNITLSDQGIPIIIDWGTAKKYTATTTNGMIGTQYYFDPLRLVHSKYSKSPVIDIFSAGILIYWFMCGCPVWDPERNKNLSNEYPCVVFRDSDRVFVPIPERAVYATEDILKLIHKASYRDLRNDAEPAQDAYQTAGQMIDDINRILAGGSISCRGFAAPKPEAAKKSSFAVWLEDISEKSQRRKDERKRKALSRKRRKAQVKRLKERAAREEKAQREVERAQRKSARAKKRSRRKKHPVLRGVMTAAVILALAYAYISAFTDIEPVKIASDISGWIAAKAESVSQAFTDLSYYAGNAPAQQDETSVQGVNTQAQPISQPSVICPTCGSTSHTICCEKCRSTEHTTENHRECPTCGSTKHTICCTVCRSTAHTGANHPRCSVCGSTAHTTHPKCSVCGSTAHTTHPRCSVCGSTAHTTHPKCSVCGSTAHTTHPKCSVCGSTAHTTHPRCSVCGSTSHTTHPKCSVCGSTSHTTHPRCSVCGSTSHTTHVYCPTCGSADHSVHPTDLNDAPVISEDFK